MLQQHRDGRQEKKFFIAEHKDMRFAITTSELTCEVCGIAAARIADSRTESMGLRGGGLGLGEVGALAEVI